VNADSVATRRAIVAAATAELTAVGYQKMNLSSVASSAGITRGAIYRYFESKLELAKAAITEEHWEYEDLLADLVSEHDGICAQLRQLIRLTMGTAFREPGASVNYFEVGRLGEADQEIAEVFRARSARVRSTISTIVHAAEKRGELAPEVDTARIVDAVSGAVWAMGAGAVEAPNETVRHQLELAVDLFLAEPGWLAKVPAKKAAAAPRRSKNPA
jgi:AcrR family transcriptional regulator